jgi:DNA-binding NarL/FixJ family response regulator
MKKRVTKEPSPPSIGSAPPKTKVLVVDDHPLLREGVSRRIDEEDDLHVCAEAATANDALALIREARPDIAVIDLSLEGSDGMTLIKDIKAQHPELPVLVLSMHDEMIYGERAIHAGAKGYVMKQAAPNVLIDAIRQVLRGKPYLSTELTNRILARLGTTRERSETLPVELLSDRELEIFELIGEGYGTREIAQQLGLSEKTIASHRENIKRKFNVRSSSELSRHAIHWLHDASTQKRAA